MTKSDPIMVELRDKGGKVVFHGDVAELRFTDESDEVYRLVDLQAFPDMLAALEKIDAIQGSSGGHKAMVDEFKYVARAAITKARGEA